MMTKKVLIIVLGDPASGKTTLARRLCPDLGLACLCKDDVKEALFDALGVTDRAGSRRYSDASFAALMNLAATQLALGQSCVLEGNWRRAHSAALAGSIAAAGARAAQILCGASAGEVERRFRTRIRHAGHLDADLTVGGFRGQGDDATGFLDLEGPRWSYRSDEADEYPGLLERLKMWRL